MHPHKQTPCPLLDIPLSLRREQTAPAPPAWHNRAQAPAAPAPAPAAAALAAAPPAAAPALAAAALAAAAAAHGVRHGRGGVRRLVLRRLGRRALRQLPPGAF